MSPWFEQVWLDRYLDGELEPEDEAWFEAYMIDQPHLLAAVDADTSLREGLALHAPAGRVEGAGEPDSVQPPSPSEPASRQGRTATWQVAPALAASLLFGLAGWFAHGFFDRDPAMAGLSAPTRLVFDTLRGVTAATRVELPDSSASWVILDIALPSDAAGGILAIEGAGQWPLTSGPDGFATVLLQRDVWLAHDRARLSYRQGERLVERELAWK